MNTSLLELPDDDVHLWWTAVPPDIEPALVQCYEALLSPQEKARQERFHFAKDKRCHLVTRALVRTVLSRYADVAPAQWTFEANAFGRPLIANPEPGACRLRFNVSHTGRFVVMAVSGGRELGVDTEHTGRQAPLDVARGFFSAQEIAALERLPLPQRPQRFWELWTFKESYIKAHGQGLSMALDRFSIHLDNAGRAALHADAALDPGFQRWQLWQLWAGPQQLIALCVEGTQPLRLVCRCVWPLHVSALEQPVVTRRPGAGHPA